MSSTRDDEYLKCGEYENHTPDSEGFCRFQSATTNSFYFSLVDDGGVIFRSEGYSSEAGRDNGIESVKRNMVDETKYSTKQLDNGRWVCSLKAANHQEIAVSCSFDNENDARGIMPSERASRKAAALAAAATVAAPAAASVSSDNKIEDDYMRCADYENKGRSAEFPDFSVFTADNGKHYFALLDSAGKVWLRSEGYPTTAARDNGLQSVIKNKEDQKRFSTEERMGFYFVVLKAGNHQEIARSCGFKSAAEADAVLTPAPAAVAHVVETPVVVAPIVEAIAPKVEAAPVIVDKEDDYAICKEYEGHTVSDKDNNVAFFTFDGQSYFVVYNADGSVRWRSEGFRTEAERNDELAGVLSNQNNDAMVKVLEKNGFKMKVLYDKSGREVGRSCLYKDAPKVEAAPVVAAVAAAAVAATVAAPAAPKEKEDDYLVCKEYEGHAINDKNNNVALFKHSNGQFYFTVYNADGSVRWRSEGFGSATERDEELSGVLKNQSNNDMMKTLEKGGFKMKVLYDKTGREVGRSCLYKDEPKVAVPVAAVAAAATVAAIAPKVEMPKVAPVVVPEPEAAGWFKWWYLLALLPLLFLLWKGCNKPTVEAPVIEAPAVVVDTPKVEAPAPVVPDACNLEWIYFDFDRDNIRTDAGATLDKVNDLLTKNPDWTVELSGHTDVKGSAAYNKALSARRYKNAKAYLTGKSIDGKRVSTTNAKNTDYIGDNDEADTQRQYNRRVEIKLMDKDGKVVCEAVKPNVSK
jgi:uncharacterized protein YegP (UPF0339 family)